jgi:putative CRISPR-associated protein (TIGR02620 family)
MLDVLVVTRIAGDALLHRLEWLSGTGMSMSRAVIVSPHAACVRWLMLNLERVDEIQFCLDMSWLEAGDCVYGQLAVEQIAALNRMAVRYFHVQVPVPFEGLPQTQETLDWLDPQLLEMRVECLEPVCPHWVS